MQGGTLSSISGPYAQVGTVYVGTVRFLGHETKVTYTVVEVEPLKLTAGDRGYRGGALVSQLDRLI
jgi:hypothetical protein